MGLVKAGMAAYGVLRALPSHKAAVLVHVFCKGKTKLTLVTLSGTFVRLLLCGLAAVEAFRVQNCVSAKGCPLHLLLSP